jgi:hypothetical protein
MIYRFRIRRPLVVCGETRARRHGYQLRCLEPTGHHGTHRWPPNS